MCRGCYAPGPDGDIAFKRISDLIDEHDILNFGVTHVVFSDDNLEDDHLETCIKNIDNVLATGQDGHNERLFPEDLEGYRKAQEVCRTLLKIPWHERYGFQTEEECKKFMNWEGKNG